ncbi:MAG: helix-turn-helix transcriptional regulator [Acidobacteria bacterium]|nr:helix-turn-helix transcriptional regulator [Acidobacteriota bacterium]
MGNELKVRAWRLAGIGEFLHVSNFEHPTSNAFHQSLALCFVDHGAFNVRHCGVNYSVGKGLLLVAQSGETTSCEDFEGKSKHREFHCAPKALETIAEETGERFTGGRIFQSPFICDESLCRPFLRFHADMDSKPTAIESSSLLREFVGKMILRYGNRPATTLKVGNERWAVKRVKDCLESRYTENLTLEELARIANLSPFHLIRVFRKEVGLPPHAYQTRLRLNHAKALLAQAATIREAALNAGFFDQSHFTHHFRKVFGYPPGVHLKGLASDAQYFEDRQKRFAR